jgi:hypothetical protein
MTFLTNIVANTASTSTTTGSLTIAGGEGLQGDLNVGGTGHIYSTANSTNTTTGAFIVDGGVAIKSDLVVGGDIKVLGTFNLDNVGLVISDGADATSTTTGAMQLAGGIGIGKSMYVGGDGHFTSGTASTSTNTGALTVVGGLGVSDGITIGGGNTTIEGPTKLTNSTATTGPATGALVVNGGLGLGGDLSIAGYIGRGKRTTVAGATYTLLETDYLIGVTVATPVTLTLPEIASLTNKDKVYIIKAEIAGPQITIVTTNADTLDGATSFTLNHDYNAISIYSDGTAHWFVF